MSGLLLVNSNAFDDWSARQQPLAAIREKQLASSPANFLDGPRSRAEGGDFERHGNVALIKCIGALGYKFSLASYLFDSSCYMGVANQVQAAAADESIVKIVLYVDSPGGTHHGLLEASDAIFAARQFKEVVAVIDPEAASAGYWLASQASRIVAIKSAWVGSVGSQVMLYSMKRMYDEAGIDIEVLRAEISPAKNQGIPYEAISDEARKERQSWVDLAGNQFIEHVMRGRGLTKKQILDNYGQGSMYFTDEAIWRQMVDAIGNLKSELAASRV